MLFENFDSHATHRTAASQSESRLTPESCLDPWHGFQGLTPKPKTQPSRELRNPKPSPCRNSETQNPGYPARNGQKFCRALRALLCNGNLVL